MAGKHSKRAVRARIPVRRRLGIDVVDAVTKLVHQVSPDALATGRIQGRYQGICGGRFAAASLAEPGRGQCAGCAAGPTPLTTPAGCRPRRSPGGQPAPPRAGTPIPREGQPVR